MHTHMQTPYPCSGPGSRVLKSKDHSPEVAFTHNHRTSEAEGFRDSLQSRDKEGWGRRRRRREKKKRVTR